MAGCGGPGPTAAGWRSGHPGRGAGWRADCDVGARRSGGRRGPPRGRRARDQRGRGVVAHHQDHPRPGLPGITAVTAIGTRDAWAFASTLARPVAWRLTGRTWSAIPFPGRSGDVVTAAASSAPGNVWAFTAQPGGAGRAVRWNGRGWTVAGRFGQAVGDAVVLGPADVWVFGQPGAPGGGLGAWHYNGTT